LTSDSPLRESIACASFERRAGPPDVRVNGQVILRTAPGVLDSQANVVSCSYTDPAGLFVEITGVLTGR
jgi:hypothetical protein